MKKFALALAALTVSAPAFAQETATSFTGGHVGIVAGYDSLDTNGSGLGNPSGFAYGVDFGYDVQAGQAVFGIEGEVAESTTRIKSGSTELAAASRDLYVGGRLGFVAGKSLVYAKAGYTNARVETPFGNENGDGFRAGIGVEYRLTGKLSLKGEYRYSDYESDVSRKQLIAGLGFRF